MLKPTYLILLFLFLTGLLSAQEANKFKFTLEAGPLIAAETGASCAIEPKFNLTHNSSIGFKLGWGLVSRNLEGIASDRYIVEQTILLGESTHSLALTYDRFFGKPGAQFQPFLGGGIAHYRFGGQYDVYAPDAFTSEVPEPEYFGRNLEFGNKLGLLLRGGFEVGKFRFGLEYNLIPENTLSLDSGETIAALNQSYFGFTLGTIIGGGKWKNSKPRNP